MKKCPASQDQKVYLDEAVISHRNRLFSSHVFQKVRNLPDVIEFLSTKCVSKERLTIMYYRLGKSQVFVGQVGPVGLVHNVGCVT